MEGVDEVVEVEEVGDAVSRVGYGQWSFVRATRVMPVEVDEVVGPCFGNFHAWKSWVDTSFFVMMRCPAT